MATSSGTLVDPGSLAVPSEPVRASAEGAEWDIIVQETAWASFVWGRRI